MNMYFPRERIYNTPELTGPAGNAVLQQIRLEAILRKYGRLDSCEPYVYSYKQVSTPLPEIKRPLRTERPFDDKHNFVKLWHGLDIPPKVPKEPSEKTRPYQENNENISDRSKRSSIPGAPPDDPYLQKPRDTVGGCKYGGVNLGEIAKKRTNADIFRPFHPQKSPHRLPCIQREKSVHKKQTAFKPNTLTDNDVAKHINILQKKKTHGLSKLKIQDSEKRKKRAKLEHEFHQWEQSKDGYLQKVHAFDSDHQILGNFERFHETAAGSPVKDAEQTQRTRISDEIKRGVQRKLNMFREDDAKFKENNNLIPVCNMTFVKNVDTFEQNKTTVRPRKEKKKRTSKKRR